jgi:hypothetical protein
MSLFQLWPHVSLTFKIIHLKILQLIKILEWRLTPNPSSKPALAHSMRDTISKKKKKKVHYKKKTCEGAQGVGPEFKSQHCKKNT